MTSCQKETFKAVNIFAEARGEASFVHNLLLLCYVLHQVWWPTLCGLAAAGCNLGTLLFSFGAMAVCVEQILTSADAN